MSAYITEEEQLEIIKKWWQKYNKYITTTLICLLLLITVYRYWTWHQDRVISEASNTYERMMVAFSNQDNRAVRSYADELINEYQHTIYADAARLTLAKIYVMHNKYEKAEKMLENVAHSSRMLPLKQVAKMRIARLFAAQKNYEKALAELNQVDDKTFVSVVNELKGDIYASTGDYKKAVASYKEAMTQIRAYGMDNPFLEMKTSELEG